MSIPIVVLDNGASTVKAGVVDRPEKTRCVLFGQLSSKRLSRPRSIIPNAVVRSNGDKMTYYGHEVERCVDYTSLHYRLPFEKVCLSIICWPGQMTIFFQHSRVIWSTGMHKRLCGTASSQTKS